MEQLPHSHPTALRKDVARAPLGAKRGLAGVDVAQLFAQATDLYLQGALIRQAIAASQRTQQGTARYRLAMGQSQYFQNEVFAGIQLDRFAQRTEDTQALLGGKTRKRGATAFGDPGQHGAEQFGERRPGPRFLGGTVGVVGERLVAVA